LADSYTQVGPTEINADSVDITGPHSLLRQINVIYTDSLFRNDVRDDVDMELALEYPDGRLVQLRPNRVRVRINVQELAEYEILNVPVAVVNGPEGAVSEPSRVSVRVRGGADLIGKLDAENDIGLTVRFELARTDEGGLIDAPKGQLFEIRQVVPARATVVTR
jgi:YbbR domain-containing protein